jgi:hypothetical protein
MHLNLFYSYLPIVALGYVVLLMFLSLVWVVARFITPLFKDLKVGRLKFTLGFYFSTFIFMYLVLPFVLINISDRLFQIWQIGNAVLSPVLGAITGYYFSKQSPTS